MLVESAVAVDNDIIGKDSDAVLIGGVCELRNACSCCRLAASNAAAADCASFDFGDVEKNCAILDALADVDLTRLLPFSLKAGKGGKGPGGELLPKGFDTRRGMAKSQHWADGMFVSRVFHESPRVLFKCLQDLFDPVRSEWMAQVVVVYRIGGAEMTGEWHSPRRFVRVVRDDG